MSVETSFSYVISNLGDFAVGEAQEFLKTYNVICLLERVLYMIQALYRDANRKKGKGEVVQELLRQFRKFAYEMEDLVGHYEYRKKSISEATVIPLSNNENLKTAQRIKLITVKIEHILLLAQTYILPHMQDEEAEGRRCKVTPAIYGYSNLLLCDDMIVGLDEDTRHINDWLLSEDDGIKLSCMAIIGMGGSGKTTLASRAFKLAYNHFDHRIWVDALAYNNDSQFLSAIIQELYQSLPSMSTRKEFQLSKDKYVLVLDNVNNVHFVHHLVKYLPHTAKAKIIITSRRNFPAPTHSSGIDFHVHLVEPLNLEFRWELFCKKAFPSQSCPDYLKQVAMQTVRRCGGLAQAIVLLADFMYNLGTEPVKWNDVLDRLSAHLTHNQYLASINHVFEESYYDLTSQLQECFAYVCLFPKGNKIKRKMIIRLWVAQGFVMKKSSQTLEEVANDYFKELIERCMLEPIYSDFTGELISFKVHDIMWELTLAKSKEIFYICDSKKIDEVLEKCYTSVHKVSEPFHPFNKKLYKARGLLLFQSVLSRFVIPNFVHLRVLLLDDSSFTSIPHEIGSLCYLKYLGLRKTPIESLPTSLQKLYNLETLDVRDTKIEAIAFDLSKFQSLKHLLIAKMKIHGRNRLPILLLGTNNLDLLQTLSGIKANMQFIDKLHQITQIEKLYIQVTPLEVAPLFKCFLCTRKLRSLKLECRDENENYAEVLTDSLPLVFPMSLEKLTFGGILNELPPCFSSLYSLRVLHLVNSMLIFDPLHDLSKLSNLVSLSLFHAYMGETMSCTSGGFPKLRHLCITSLTAFEEWAPIEEGTMPCIQFVSIIDCGRLRMLPKGFEKLIKLQSLEVINMPQEFLIGLETMDFYKVQHISMKSYIPKDTKSSAGERIN